MITRKEPEECQDMVDIRQEIDNIDRHVISLIGKRFRYVKAAAKFKKEKSDVAAPERLKTMLIQRRAWATEFELSPDVIEKLFLDLVNHFILEESKAWDKFKSRS